MVKVKAHELRQKKKSELLKQLEELKIELAGLRVHQVVGGTPAKLAKIKDIRKSIARVNTVLSQTQRHQLRLHYKGHKYKPLDLRPKKIRKLRKKLTRKYRMKKTLKLQKKLQHFPKRKYAVKAT